MLRHDSAGSDLFLSRCWDQCPSVWPSHEPLEFCPVNRQPFESQKVTEKLIEKNIQTEKNTFQVSKCTECSEWTEPSVLPARQVPLNPLDKASDETQMYPMNSNDIQCPKCPTCKNKRLILSRSVVYSSYPCTICASPRFGGAVRELLLLIAFSCTHFLSFRHM